MPDNYKLIILPEAQRDIRDIVMYIARDLGAPQAALKLQDNFEKAIASLAIMPERIKTVDEQPWKNAGVRKLKVKNYYIYFMISKSDRTVKIMAVIYSRLDQQEQMTGLLQ